MKFASVFLYVGAKLKFWNQWSASTKAQALLLVLVAEIIIGIFVWRYHIPKIVFGFLIKNGDHYVLAWKDEGFYLQEHDYRSLKEAVHFARKELNLSASGIGVPPSDIDSVWIEDSMGSFQVLWKEQGPWGTHRLTFKRQADALFFANAFRNGRYSTSPLGHSIRLTPIRLQMTR